MENFLKNPALPTLHMTPIPTSSPGAVHSIPRYACHELSGSAPVQSAHRSQFVTVVCCTVQSAHSDHLNRWKPSICSWLSLKTEFLALFQHE